MNFQEDELINHVLCGKTNFSYVEYKDRCPIEI